MVPHLTTALSGPLLALEKKFLSSAAEIEQWIRLEWQNLTPPFYASTDLRNAGFKLTPVDLNLFPAGFNNLGIPFLPLCIQATQAAIERLCPNARNLLLIPENHTRNQFYLQNVAQLVNIMQLTGLTIRIGTLIPEIDQATTLELDNGTSLTLEPLVMDQGKLGVAGFTPCAILLNNDLSAGVPDILKQVNTNDQWLIPPLHAGWQTRRKSHHATVYSRISQKFASVIGIDPWHIDPAFSVCHQIDFQARTGEECLSEKVDQMLRLIHQKYKEYGIDETPYVVIKPDAGTYGMGIMTVKDASEVVGLNRKQRNKMSVIKEGMQVSDVIIQEGVPTFEQVQGAVAEPVVYMMDHYVIGGFYRVHTGKGRDDNLNSPGMYFEPLAFDTSCSLPDTCKEPDSPPNRFYAYGVIARLALLAAAIELEETRPTETAELAA